MGKITLGIIFLGIGFSSISLADSDAIIHRGTVILTINEIIAVNLNGTPASPKDTASCKHQYFSRLGSRIKVKYRINTKTLLESAVAEYQGVSTFLHPLGVSNAYDFMSDGVVSPRDLRQISFDLTKQFSAPLVSLLFVNKDNPNTQCLLLGS